MVVKIHHAVADGSAAVALLQNAVQGVTDRSRPVDPIDDPWLPEPIPTRRQLLSMAAHDQVTRWKGLPHLVRRSIKQARASEHRRRSFAPRPPLPLHHIPKTSFNVSITSERTFAMTSLPLGELRPSGEPPAPPSTTSIWPCAEVPFGATCPTGASYPIVRWWPASRSRPIRT